MKEYERVVVDVPESSYVIDWRETCFNYISLFDWVNNESRNWKIVCQIIRFIRNKYSRNTIKQVIEFPWKLENQFAKLFLRKVKGILLCNFISVICQYFEDLIIIHG